MIKPPAIECRNVWKVFGDYDAVALDEILSGRRSKEEIQEAHGCIVAVADANFTIEAGEVFCIMGLSGSGKSTLLRHINGLVVPTAGGVFIDGENIASLSKAELRKLRAGKMGMVFQSFALLPHRNVLENVAFGLELRGMPEAERMAKARTVLKAVKLEAWEGAAISELSGGMQQRVGLARALAGDPDILLMDEPFGALDPLIRRQLQDQFSELCLSLKKTAVFITHDLDEAMRIGSRIAIMRDGCILQIGAPHEIILAPADPHVAAFVRNVSSKDTLMAKHIMTKVAPRQSTKIRDAVGVALDTVLSDAARLAAQQHHDLPVRDGTGRVMGILRIEDILTAIAGRVHHAEV